MSTTDTEYDVLPPLEQVKAALAAWRPRAVALASYASDVEAIPLGPQDVTTDGLTVHLPAPLEGFPATQAALQRAQARARSYPAGTVILFRWAFQLMQFQALFDHASTQLTGFYSQIGNEGPTPEQRTAVLSLFAGLISTLEKDRQLLVEANTAYANVLPLLAEDQGSLGAEVAGVSAAAAALQQKMQDLMLQYALNPLTRGLAPILQKSGQLQIDRLRRTAAALRQVVAECTQAHEAVAQLAGELLTTVGKYRGLESALTKAQGTTFKYHLQQTRFNIAREQWKSLSDYALQTLAG
ncbi:hypothetical protein F0P96_18080 [Hymenobacter busanensis]|uniref:Uncharacterized protein n=1 Tax=Hymenobacter busanensis TaxID=2607656 RepID=A0A7L4ZWK9_9BACT|nr:hypothetical protein [Hymenobacter busanensis]KAA9327145.1 hypothetical protein F0P96_18080 [Hymenobacter busanensis]QHJ05810.1 hypothetical protein GUY19_00275 [Hymenobacter busanensis]